MKPRRVLSRGRGRALAYRSAPPPCHLSRSDAAGQRLARNPLPRATRRGLLGIIALLLLSCGPAPSTSSSPRTATTIPIPTTAPPPSASPTPTPTPRIGPAVVENVQLVAAGLRAPWAVDIAPDGRLFVTERPGRVRIVQLGPGGGLRAEPWATVPASTSTDGEKGLLGIAVDPEFARNGFVYLYYSYAAANGPTRDKLVRMRDADGHGVDESILLDGIPGNNNHDGGRVKFRERRERSEPRRPRREDPASEQGRLDPLRQPHRGLGGMVARPSQHPGHRVAARHRGALRD